MDAHETLPASHNAGSVPCPASSDVKQRVGKISNEDAFEDVVLTPLPGFHGSVSQLSITEPIVAAQEYRPQGNVKK